MPDWSAGARAPHPSLEMLSAYADGKLDDRAKAEVEEHIADCEACLELVGEVIETIDGLDEVGGRDVGGRVTPIDSHVERRNRRNPLVVWGSVVLAAAAAWILAVPLRQQWFDGGAETDLEAIVAALADVRTVEGRLSGGFPYRPLRAATRSASTSSDQDNLAMLQAAAALQKAVASSPTPSRHRAYGVALLLIGRRAEALQQLQAAMGPEKPGADELSDLAATRLSIAREDGDVSQWTLALRDADRALSLDSHHREALFNRALALEGLAQRDEAIAGWEAYLREDPSSAWAVEAKRRIDTLKAAPAAWEHFRAPAAMRFVASNIGTNPTIAFRLTSGMSTERPATRRDWRLLRVSVSSL